MLVKNYTWQREGWSLMNTHPPHEHNSECRHLLDSLSDYVDGVLEEALCHEIEAHMAECENCQVVVNTLARTVELYQTTPAPDLPQDVKKRLFKSLKLEDFLDAASPDVENRSDSHQS